MFACVPATPPPESYGQWRNHHVIVVSEPGFPSDVVAEVARSVSPRLIYMGQIDWPGAYTRGYVLIGWGRDSETQIVRRGTTRYRRGTQTIVAAYVSIRPGVSGVVLRQHLRHELRHALGDSLGEHPKGH